MSTNTLCKGKYHYMADLLKYWIGFNCVNLLIILNQQSYLIQTSKTEGQPYIDTSPYKVPK